MSYTVVFAPEAEAHLAELYRYIATEIAGDRKALHGRHPVVLRKLDRVPASRNTA